LLNIDKLSRMDVWSWGLWTVVLCGWQFGEEGEEDEEDVVVVEGESGGGEFSMDIVLAWRGSCMNGDYSCMCDVWMGSVSGGKVYLCSVVGDKECLDRLGHEDCGAAQWLLSVSDGIKARSWGGTNFGLGEMKAGDKCGNGKDILEYLAVSGRCALVKACTNFDV
jgi:hypothetical protein